MFHLQGKHKLNFVNAGLLIGFDKEILIQIRAKK